MESIWPGATNPMALQCASSLHPVLRQRGRHSSGTPSTVGNLVLIAFLGRGKRNLAVVGLALLLSCCTNERETKILLGIPDTVEQTPDTDADRNIFACRQYGFVSRHPAMG